MPDTEATLGAFCITLRGRVVSGYTMILSLIDDRLGYMFSRDMCSASQKLGSSGFSFSFLTFDFLFRHASQAAVTCLLPFEPAPEAPLFELPAGAGASGIS